MMTRMRKAVKLIALVGLQTDAFVSATEFPDASCCLILDIRLQGLSGLDFPGELANARTSPSRSPRMALSR
jgi:FixJ family two-component response regulator